MPQVQVDPARMQTNDVSLDEVMETTANALDVGILQYSNGAMIGTGGFIDTPNQQISVRSVLPIVTPDDLAQVPIEGKQKKDGTPLLLSDVADVREATWPLIGDAVINDGPGLMLVVEKFPWANTLDVTRGVEDALERVAAGPARHPDGLYHLSPGGLYPGGARQSDAGLDSRLPARDARDRRLSLRVAHGADQPGGDPALAGGRRPGALPAWGDHQHDDSGRVCDCHWGRRRRCDHRRRKHRAAAAAVAQRGRPIRGHEVDGEHHSRGVARSTPGHHPCDADRCRGLAARSSSWEGYPALSSSRWQFPMAWQCWHPCWWR